MAQGDDLDLHVDVVAVLELAQEVGLDVHRGQAQIVYVQHVGEIDVQHAAEELLDGQVEVVQEPWVVDDAGVVDVREADSDRRTERIVLSVVGGL